MTLMISVILLSVLMIIASTMSVVRLLIWQQLKVASYVESDLPDTVDLGRKLLVAINAGKHQLVSFHWSSKSCANCKSGKICS